MTVTIFRSGNNDEPLCETIRYLIASNWTVDPAPTFLSPQGSGTSAASASKLNFGRTWNSLNRQNVIKVYNGADEPLSDSRYLSEFMTTVYIDIFARTMVHVQKYCNEVNRIIFENQANVNTDIATSDNNVSKITGFRQNVIPWIYPSDLQEAGASIQAAGELDCKWQIHLS